MKHAFKVGDLAKLHPDHSWRYAPRFGKSLLKIKSVYWSGEAYSVSRTTRTGREESLYVGNSRYLIPRALNKNLGEYF